MIVHAAGETGPAGPHTIAILLQVANEEELLSLMEIIPEAHLIREPDPPFNGEAMALALKPGSRKRELRKLRLWNP